MRQVLSTLVLFACSIPLFAQSTPKAEVFGGFSYLNYEVLSVNLPNGSITENCTSSSSSTTSTCQTTPASTPTLNFNPRMGLYGWNGSVTADLTPWFGFTTDFSGNYGKATDSITTTLTTTTIPCTLSCTFTDAYQLTVSDPTVYTFLFGPQFYFPAGKAKAYGRFLAGGEHKSVNESQTDTINGSVLPSMLATSATSGNYFAMAFGGGVDYPIRKKLSWRIGADYLTSTGTAQNHVRILTGVVWRLGK
ncbi:MAG: outer membrane beta-barrel protein [Terracidiphilus sp.]|jgi:hypothetical protein